MWTVEAPRVTAEQAAKACAKSIRNQLVKHALLNAVPNLTANSDSYQHTGVTDRLHEATAELFHVPGVSDEQMRAIYSGQLACGTAAGRRVYDELMSAAPYGLCAYCRYGVATTLDHFVPKSVVGGLSIEPWNLVPCCATCNHKLNAAWSTSQNEQLLHPYFIDDLGRWLHARLVHDEPPVAVFYAEPASDVDANIADRIGRQFAALKLDRLYSTVSAVELARLDAQFTSKEARLPIRQAVRDHLSEAAASWLTVDVNDRRGVLYETLSADDWFTTRYAES